MIAMGDSRPGVRNRVREAIRDELTAAAIDAFEQRGYRATTASDIAGRVGVSERTFFRYFPTKEDAVLHTVESLGDVMVDALRIRPVGESAFQALRACFDEPIRLVARVPGAMSAVIRLNRNEPALRGRYLLQQDTWITGLEKAMIERQGETGRSSTIRLQCATSILAWQKALGECATNESFEDLAVQVDKAFEEQRRFLDMGALSNNLNEHEH